MSNQILDEDFVEDKPGIEFQKLQKQERKLSFVLVFLIIIIINLLWKTDELNIQSLYFFTLYTLVGMFLAALYNFFPLEGLSYKQRYTRRVLIFLIALYLIMVIMGFVALKQQVVF